MPTFMEHYYCGGMLTVPSTDENRTVARDAELCMDLLADLERRFGRA